MVLNFKKWNAEKEETARITFLHGMGGVGSMWRPIAANLEDHYSVLAVDQRGHGGSRPVTGGFTPLEFGQDVIDTLDAERFYPTFLVGHSMGVRTAVAAAHLRPDWFQGLILVDLGFSGVAGGGMGIELADFMKKLPAEFPSRAEARSFLEANCPDPSIAQYLMAVAIQKSAGVGFPFDPLEMVQVVEAAKNSDVRDWVRNLKMPILVLRGGKSQVFSEKAYQSEKTAFKDLHTIQFEEIPNVGHGLPFENRAAFVARIQSFIEDIQILK